jgi:hypothetical protein
MTEQQEAGQLAYAGERYYRHTGRAPLFGTTVATLAVWAAIIALAIAYAYTDLYVKVADLVSALIVILFAAAGGVTVYFVMRWAKVRNTGVIVIVAISAALLLFYGSWVFWESALSQNAGRGLSPWFLSQRPWIVWRYALRINLVGTFTLNDRAVTGGELWAAWIGEAVLLIGATIAIPILRMRGQAFCENCGAWCKRNKDVARVQHFDEELVREHMEEKDFEYLVRLGPASKGTPVHLRVELLSCPRCGQTHLLTVNRISMKYINGQAHEDAKAVVDRLWVDPQQAEMIRKLPAMLSARAEIAKPPAESPAANETQPQIKQDSPDQQIP